MKFTSTAVFFLLLINVNGFVDAQVIESTDSSGRPTEISGFMTNSQLYNISITYDIDGFVDPILVGDLPEQDINLAADELALFLTSEDPLASGEFLNILFYDPNSTISNDGDPSTFDVHATLYGDSSPTFYNAGVSNWTNTTKYSWAGFSEFTAVPEPATSFIVGVLGSLFLFQGRRRVMCAE